MFGIKKITKEGQRLRARCRERSSECVLQELGHENPIYTYTHNLNSLTLVNKILENARRCRLHKKVVVHTHTNAGAKTH